MNTFIRWFICICAAFPPISGRACCALGRLGEPVVNADQTVLIIWDPTTKTEHFIRKASFKAEGGDFGFLVPTPTRPQLSESGNAAFPLLAQITRPRLKSGGGGFGCSASSSAEYRNLMPAVTVVERKEVAGFDAAVLTANSASALTDWLKAHGYDFSPEIAAWAAPYIRDGWMLTALRVTKRKDTGKTHDVDASALRISFHTERPLFPYREPESRAAARSLGTDSRLLRLYFVSSGRYDGKLDNATGWSGKPVWSAPVESAQRNKLLDLLKLPLTTGPVDWWLTEFEDKWPYSVAPGDLYFSPSLKQAPLVRWADNSWQPTTDISLPVGLLIGSVVLLRKRMT